MTGSDALFQAWSLALAALATWQTVELWNHAEIFAERRAAVENYDNFFARLLTCPQCLSVWVAGAWAVCLLVPWPWPALPVVVRIAAFSMAASRLANFANDWCKANGCMRKPKAYGLRGIQTGIEVGPQADP